MKDVTIRVDARKERGSLRRIWRSLGYDEINWTYTNIGNYIYSQINELHDGPYWIRNHNAFTSGNLISTSAWGSTNCYTEDKSGKPHYDWSCIDRVYDTFLENNCKPMIELDFMPHDLSSHPEVGPKESWRYPPKDYSKWKELNLKFAEHLMDRYGKAEVRSWFFSTWNEADISYFKWKPDENLNAPEHRKARDEEFFKVHDHTSAAIWSADSRLCVGGPDLAYDEKFLDRFLDHCHNGKNYVTGETGSRLGFVSVHVKGTRMDSDHKVKSPDYDDVARRRLLKYWQVIKKYERFRNLPIIGNEWDIDVGTVLGTFDSPDWEFRNNSYYPTFVIRTMRNIHDLIEGEGMNIELVTQWAFYFHGKRCFEGFRAIFDPFGIRKPVFNAFEMLSRLGSVRIEAQTNDKESDIAPGEVVGMDHRRPRDYQDAQSIPKFDQVASHPSVDALATKEENGVQILVWHQVCDQHAAGERRVRIDINGLNGWDTAAITHYRISEDCSNAYTAWKALGRPDWPTEAQLRVVKEKEHLEKCQPDMLESVENGSLQLGTNLPMHSVSMFILAKPLGCG